MRSKFTTVACLLSQLPHQRLESRCGLVHHPRAAYLHFKQIFNVAHCEGYGADLRHITFGSILGEDRKLMKTRSGENVELWDLPKKRAGARKMLQFGLNLLGIKVPERM